MIQVSFENSNRVNNLESVCYGCSACGQICPKKAIQFKKGANGFYFPSISDSLCVDCGLCRKVCPALSHVECEKIPQIVFAAKHRSKNVLLASSSGGIFTALTDSILKDEGIVVGAGYNYNEHIVEHCICKTSEERDQIRGSKYIQSDPKNIFRQIKDELKTDKKVFFIGTPCQVAGLNSYLKFSKVDTNQLLTCDIICHGVGSPEFWYKTICLIEKKLCTSIDKITFKDKRRGWTNPLSIAFSGKKRYSLRPYTVLYFDNDIMRESCYHCKYSSLQRESDITIGDFWRVKQFHPEIYDTHGVSVVLVNTEKGRELFKDASDNLEFVESNITECMQNNLQYPTTPGRFKDEFWRDYNNKKFEFVIRKWYLRLMIKKVKDKIFK